MSANKQPFLHICFEEICLKDAGSPVTGPFYVRKQPRFETVLYWLWKCTRKQNRLCYRFKKCDYPSFLLAAGVKK